MKDSELDLSVARFAKLSLCIDMLQTVHFIRHGEGFHNIGFDGNEDAHLTPFGWSQAHALHDHIQHNLRRPLDIQVQHAPVVHHLRKLSATVTPESWSKSAIIVSLLLWRNMAVGRLA